MQNYFHFKNIRQIILLRAYKEQIALVFIEITIKNLKKINLLSKNSKIKRILIIKQQKLMIKALFYLFSIIEFLNAQIYEVSIDYPFLVSNQGINIKRIACDYQSNFWLFMADGTVRRYDPLFSSFTVIPYPEQVQLLNFNRINFPNLRLSNGTNFTCSSKYQAIVFNNFTSISFHDYVNFSILQSYQMNDKIIRNVGYSLQYPNSKMTPFNFVIYQSSMKLLFKSAIYSIYDYSTTFGSNLIALTACQLSYSAPIPSPDYAQFNYVYYVALNNSKVYLVGINITFLFNFTTNSYDFLRVTANNSILVTLAQSINKMVISTYLNILLMQSLSNQYYFYDKLRSVSGAGSANMSSFIMKQLIERYGKVYILSTTGLIQISYVSRSLKLLSIIVSLPSNDYLVQFGLYFDLLYAVGGPNVYKANLCLNQSIAIASSCYQYNCSVSDCNYCPLNNATCGVCDSGYIRSYDYLCDPNNLANTSNTLAQDMFIMNVANIQILNLLLQYLLKSLNKAISIPGARALVSPIFYLFGNFDDLYLYQFHDRQYNQVMTDFFNQLNNIEANKWNTINYTDFLSSVFDYHSFNNFVNFQQQYQSFNYTYNTINVNQSEGLFYNSQSYFIVVIPITTLYFCLFHLAFRLLARFSFSKLLRKFYFLLFLLIIQTDGNVQQLVFYLARQFLSIFFMNLYQKLLKIAIVYYGFIFMFISCTIFYFVRILYFKTSKVLMESYKISQLGTFSALFHLGLRNIIFSFLHFYGRYFSESILLQLLLGCQVLLILLMIFLLIKKIFTQYLKIGLMIALSIFRTFLIVTLMMDQQGTSEMIQDIQLIIIMAMIIIFCLGIVIDMLLFFKYYITFFIENGCCINKVNPNAQQTGNNKRYEEKKQLVMMWINTQKSKPRTFKIVKQNSGQNNNIKEIKNSQTPKYVIKRKTNKTQIQMILTKKIKDQQ